MQTFFAASFDMMRPTAAPSPSTSPSSTGTKQAFTSHLHQAADKRAASRQSTNDRNTVAPDQDDHTLSDSTEVPESTITNGQQPAAEQDALKDDQTDSSDPLESSVTQPSSAQVAEHFPVTGPLLNPGRTNRSGTTVERMLGAITGTTISNDNGAIAANSDRTLPETGGNPASPVITTPPANAMAVNTTSAAADDWLSASHSRQISVQSSGSIQSDPSSSPAATTIVFNPSNGSVTITADDVAPLSSETEGDPDAPLVVQNKYGQIITIQYNNTPALTPGASAAVSGHPQTTTNNSTMDIANHYIHSHLPDHADVKAENASDNGIDNGFPKAQSTPLNSTGQDFDSQTALEQLTVPKNLSPNGGESQPFLFSHQQAVSQSGTTAPTTESFMYRLPSGTFVPEGTVTDQMIAHFSFNKRLESGSINLKLYPQELGELRMEIKVEQDNVRAHIIAQSPQAQEMIDRHMPKLREALEQQGLQLQQIEVTVATQDNGGGERFQDSSAWQQARRSATSHNPQTLFEHQLEEELSTEQQTDNNLNVIA